MILNLELSLKKTKDVKEDWPSHGIDLFLRDYFYTNQHTH